MTDDEALKCSYCGCRRWRRTEVLSARDGNPYGGAYDEVLVCEACDRYYYLKTDGDKVTLQLAVGFKSVPTVRVL